MNEEIRDTLFVYLVSVRKILTERGGEERREGEFLIGMWTGRKKEKERGWKRGREGSCFCLFCCCLKGWLGSVEWKGGRGGGITLRKEG